MTTLLRLLAAIGSLSIAWLAVLPAPTTTLWEAAIVVTECGHLLAIVPLLALLPGWRRTRAGRVSAALNLLAAALFLSPLARALPIAARLPREVTAAFGGAPLTTLGEAARPRPIVALDLARGVRSPRVAVATYTYSPARGGLRMDVSRPSDGAPHPALLVIHGGSWQSGDRTQLAALNGYLAARGYVVAAIDYRMGRANPFPAALEDVRAALAYLARNAATLHVDSTRIALLGRSAGAELALLAAFTAHDPRIRGAVSLYGPLDLRWGYAHPASPRVIDSRGVLRAYLGGDTVQAPAAYDAASPYFQVGPDTPPTLLIHGARDELVHAAQSERMASRLALARRPHLLVELPASTHGCDYFFWGPCGQITTYAVERFLAAVMR